MYGELTRDEYVVVLAYAMEEISIGRAREILGWRDSVIRKESHKMVCKSSYLQMIKKESRDN